jgi:hypothetical protein
MAAAHLDCAGPATRALALAEILAAHSSMVTSILLAHDLASAS